jgi:hypothetical protein
MQLTRFDHWLREKFVYETHIHTLRMPESLPKGIRNVQLPDVSGKRYKCLLVAKTCKDAELFINELKQNSQMYATQIVEKNRWYVPWIAPKNKSITWWLFSTLLTFISVFLCLMKLKTFTDDSKFRKTFFEAIDIFKK